ncbi:alpha/beta fold hydrolase [Mucilaginibacter auburnensis]|uniref:Pimeloyl-ACP methyl ester carboxylesterase n=1 Tax=Mucilaginibacter auburnensis TaxID=1457233 RepID=A0A2H9VP45_9SPHI|nr:alpha/beta hydrolase [Mucilaginibacter auburnensis]PJJ80128.1 pimeloyl-ACP methyl ester carboxylesterase [Mucilaginibacter auburnensis]
MTTLKTSGHAPVNGISMYYEIHGEGKMPLVLIHGGGSTIETSFGVLLPLLAANHKVIAVELQAHGRTTDRNSPETFEQDADDVAGLLQYLKVEKVDILGFSNGGTTTLQVAIRHPQVVNKIVVMAGAYKRDGFMNGFFDFMQTATFESMPQPLKDAYLKVTSNKDGLLNMFNKDKQRMIDFKDIPDEAISSIKALALFMVSDKDVITAEHTLAMSRLVANSQLIVLPGTHGQFFGEMGSPDGDNAMPRATAILIGEFLKR